MLLAAWKTEVALFAAECFSVNDAYSPSLNLAAIFVCLTVC